MKRRKFIVIAGGGAVVTEESFTWKNTGGLQMPIIG
jgi:hypothetical protein